MNFKKLVCGILLAFCGNLLNAQFVNSTLLQNNRVINRDNPATINPDWAPFYHGVASGDPLSDRVIIWTRITPENNNGEDLTVKWSIASNPELSDIIKTGFFTTNADRDYTIKVDVDGLEAGQTYYYGFEYDGKASLTGKTKTTPTGDSVEHLRFGVVSCSNFQAGYFNAYGRLADRNDLDAILHLGDYIYEYADGYYGDAELTEERPLEPAYEILSEEDYRIRYSTYRLDTNLVRVHQQHPFITVWDDHESANDSYTDGAENHDESTEGSWEERKAIAKKVYFEWLPIREQTDNRVYRSIQYGDLMDLIMLDTRLEGRNEQINDSSDPALFATDRTILGQEQKNWFKDQLNNSQAKWKVIGQQVIFSEFNVGWAALGDTTSSFNALESIFLDIWDGYPAERTEIIDFIEDNNIDNVVMLTGDFHCSFAFDVTDNPNELVLQNIPGVGEVPVYLPSTDYDQQTGTGSSLVEFATPSITSANFNENLDDLTAIGFQLQINNPINTGGLDLGNPNPHLKAVNLIEHGYFILDIKDGQAQGNWYFTDISVPNTEENFAFGWYSNDGDNHLQEGEESQEKAVQDIPAPENPPVISSTSAVKDRLIILNASPNPCIDSSSIHYALNEKSIVEIYLMDNQGKRIKTLISETTPKGQYTLKVDLSELTSGLYQVVLKANEQSQSIQLMKAD